MDIEEEDPLQSNYVLDDEEVDNEFNVVSGTDYIPRVASSVSNRQTATMIDPVSGKGDNS
jgi:hypothetical protein